MKKKKVSQMQEQLQGTVAEMRKQGINLMKDHPLFKWSYPDDPNIEFQLLILEKLDSSLATEDDIVH